MLARSTHVGKAFALSPPFLPSPPARTHARTHARTLLIASHVLSQIDAVNPRAHVHLGEVGLDGEKVGPHPDDEGGVRAELLDAFDRS